MMPPWDAVMHKYKAGKLHSGGSKGPIVKNRKQAIAIMLSEKRHAATNPEYRPGRMPAHVMKKRAEAARATRRAK